MTGCFVRFRGRSGAKFGTYAMSWLAGVNSVSHVRFSRVVSGTSVSYVVENHRRQYVRLLFWRACDDSLFSIVSDLQRCANWLRITMIC